MMLQPASLAAPLWTPATGIALFSLAISATTFIYNYRVNRPKLLVRARKGDWYKWQDMIQKPSSYFTGEVLFQGIIELYNRSSRANAIHTYEFWAKNKTGRWEKLESEHYTNKQTEGSLVFNQTPLGLAPYSGAEARVQAFIKRPEAREI